ncbi:MAG: DUF554 domain-containing protein [Lachnospiraceae bacterium]|nr:DUF554 domain-containing protein [Lachnospiraceae bacterium]
MIGLGTIINVAAIVFGGIFGLVFGKVLSGRVQSTMITTLGVCTIFIGISGALQQMYTVNGGKIEAGGTMMMIGSFVFGSLVGEWLNLEDKMEQFGSWLKIKTKSDKDTGFIDGFVTTSLTVCIGAMAVVGAIQDGIYGDYSLLTAKAVLDLILVAVMTSTMGKGCIFSAIPVAVFQGSVTFLAIFIEPLMTPQALSNLSLTGSMLIFCVGANLVFGKRIKVANMLPTIVFAVAWAFLPF